MLKTLKNLLLSMISEDNGNVSSMRIITMLVIGVSLFNWTWATIATGALASMSWSQIAMILGALTAKGAQKKLESKKK